MNDIEENLRNFLRTATKCDRADVYRAVDTSGYCISFGFNISPPYFTKNYGTYIVEEIKNRITNSIFYKNIVQENEELKRLLAEAKIEIDKNKAVIENNLELAKKSQIDPETCDGLYL